MAKFFVDRRDFKRGNVIIRGENFDHLSKVLRAKKGDEVVVTDNHEVDYICTINGFFPDHITARIEDFNKNRNESLVKVHLFQCLPKHDKMDSIIQKCVELGVHKIYPVVSSRCIMRLDDNRGEKKVSRWQRISESAAKQSGRGIIPEISEVICFEEAVKIAAEMDVSIISYEREEKNILKDIDFNEKLTIGIFTGPEGGFDDEEINMCVKSGIIPVSLGNRILRTETAGINALSIIMFLIENM